MRPRMRTQAGSASVQRTTRLPIHWSSTATFLVRVSAPLLVALAVSTPTFAQSCRPLHARNPDGNYIIPGVRGDIRYTGELALDAYVQPGADRRPSVVVIHGGTWSSGSRV